MSFFFFVHLFYFILLIAIYSSYNSSRGKYRLFLRSVTAFGHTKIGTQILIDQLATDIILILFNSSLLQTNVFSDVVSHFLLFIIDLLL